MGGWTRALILTGAPLLAVLGAAGCSAASARGTLSGQQLYGACAQCHGADGAGDAKLGAPRIAGLPGWYVGVQLRHFKEGVRGKHPDDAEGLRMRAMSRQMLTDGEIDSVTQYVAHLSGPKKPFSGASADLAAGKAAFELCTACHGDHGEGSEEMKAPPLATLDRWYVESALLKFKAGVRGSVASDDTGGIMQGAASTLEATQARDVAAYIETLAR